MRGYAQIPFVAALTLAAFLPQTTEAQQEPVEPEAPQCTAEVDAEAITIGEVAVPVAFQLSEAIGAVTDIESASGLAIAAADDLPRVEMANEEAAPPQPIQMSNDAENTFILYLNSADAEEGTHDLWLIGEEGRCAAQVVLQPAA